MTRKKEAQRRRSRLLPLAGIFTISSAFSWVTHDCSNLYAATNGKGDAHLSLSFFSQKNISSQSSCGVKFGIQSNQEGLFETIQLSGLPSRKCASRSLAPNVETVLQLMIDVSNKSNALQPYNESLQGQGMLISSCISHYPLHKQAVAPGLRERRAKKHVKYMFCVKLTTKALK